MKANRTAILAMAALLIGLMGCVSARRQAVLQDVSARSVDPAVYQKMQDGDSLGLNDIEHLVASGVPEDRIIDYIKEERAIYNLSTTEVDRLRKAGVTDYLIDYLLKTPSTNRRYYYNYPYHYPYHSPYYYRHGIRIHHHHHF